MRLHVSFALDGRRVSWVNGAWVPDPPRRPSFATAFGDLAELLTVRPLGTWPGDKLARDPVRSNFKASWGATCALLARELKLVATTSTVLQLDVDERAYRRDGLPRADARVGYWGVILSFEHVVAGPLSYPCNRFDDWQDNVRAIALSLEALRAVDRYGVTRSAEQYRGWRALPPSTDTPLTAAEAGRIIVAEAGDFFSAEDRREGAADDVVCDPDMRTAAIRAAIKRTHPDAGGNADAFHRVQRARKVLEAQ